jgi:hypothetical protein
MTSETATHPLGRHTNGVWHSPEIRPINNWNGSFPPGTKLVNMFDREDLGYGPKWKAAQEAERLAAIAAAEAAPAAAAEVVEVAAGTAVAAVVEKPEAGTPATIVADGESLVIAAPDVAAYTGSALAAASFNAPAPVPAAAGAPAQ